MEADYTTPFGYSLHYRVEGTGSEKILFVIGFCASASYWGPLISGIHAKYPGRYTTCVYDQRGTGLSSTSLAEKCTSVTVARDALGLLLHLSWIGRQVPLHLVAWSMGGFGSIELLNMLLRELDSILNISSLTLCNTGHKLSFLPIKAWIPVLKLIGKGASSLLLGISPRWMIPDVLKLHYSKTFLQDSEIHKNLSIEYETRSPFNAPLSKSLIGILQQFYAVLTHYVPRERMKAIKDSGLTIHAVISSEDCLIHPTASMTLARILNCDFSYLPGGHMSHVEHTDVIVERLVGIWEQGLEKKYPQYKKYNHVKAPMSRAMSLGTPSEISTGLKSYGMRNADIRIDETTIIASLNQLVRGGMDVWSFHSIRQRMREPGRLFIAPALIFPVALIQLRKILLGKHSKTERCIELGLLLYIIGLVSLVHEVSREEG